jgi:hypothetical protein
VTEAQQSSGTPPETPPEKEKQVRAQPRARAAERGKPRATVWDDKGGVPNPNERKSIAEDPDGSANAKLVKGKGKK